MLPALKTLSKNLADPQDPSDELLIDIRFGEVVECAVVMRLGVRFLRKRSPFKKRLDELSAFASALRLPFDAALPFKHMRNVFDAVSQKKILNCFKVDEPVTETTESAGSPDPRLEAADGAAPCSMFIFRIFDMIRLNPRGEHIDEGHIVEMHKYEVRRVVVDAVPWMTLGYVEKALIAVTIMHVFSVMKLECHVHVIFVRIVEYRDPASSQFGKALFHQSSGTLRPRIVIWNKQPSGEAGHRSEAKIVICLDRQTKLLDCPIGPRLFVSTYLRSGKPVEQLAIGVIHGNKLSLEVCRQFGDPILEAIGNDLAHKLIAVVLRVGGLCEVDDSR